MRLHEFPRHPLTFGPSPVHRLDRLSAHLGGASVWAKREDCNSGLAFGGNKTRKLEYIVPDVLAKGADTLVSIGGYPVQPHPTGGGRRGAPRTEVPAGPGEVGRLGRPGQRQGRQHPALADHGRRRAARRERLRHRDPAVVGGGHRRGRGRRRHAVRHPGRGLRAPARRPGLRQLGLRGRGPGAGARRLLRHDRGLHGHRLHARRDDRRLRRPRGADRSPPPRPRHRRLGHAREDARPGRSGSPATPRR